jgi:hypothetical protein
VFDFVKVIAGHDREVLEASCLLGDELGTAACRVGAILFLLLPPERSLPRYGDDDSQVM